MSIPFKIGLRVCKGLITGYHISHFTLKQMFLNLKCTYGEVSKSKKSKQSNLQLLVAIPHYV